MKLTQPELLQIYEAVVLPFGHPDPLGYMTRALLLSDGDPDFVDGNKRGFMPVNPTVALDMVGAQEVQSVQANVLATLAMDRLNFDKYGNVDDMVVAFHFESDMVDTENRTRPQQELLNDIEDARQDVYETIYPPFATVEDVIKVIKDSQNTADIPKERIEFFELLLDGA